jgi:ubiquinone/menaquinone biosynthesis C-methylase UbiE
VASHIKRQVDTYADLADWYNTYYRDNRTWPTSQQYTRNLIQLLRRAGLTNTKRKTLLDVACGGGYFLEYSLSFFRGAYGCDISQVALREVQRRCGRLRLCQANAERLPYRDRSFDVVSCLGSLEHFFALSVALAELRRVVKPEGWILVLVPTNPDWAVYDIQPTEVVMGPHEWEVLFAQSGLRTILSVETDQYADLKASSAGCQVYCVQPAF